MKEFKPPLFVFLNNALRDASLGMSEYYSDAFRNEAEEYHKTGATWTDERLEKFFAEGLLNHYVCMATGINLNPKYLSANNKPSQPKKVRHFNAKEQLIGMDIHMRISEDDAIQKVIIPLLNKIKSIKLLLRIGGRFQRMKQQNEQIRIKYASETNNYSEEEKSLDSQVLYDNDRLMELSQLAIVNWVAHFAEEVRFYIERNDPCYPYSDSIPNMVDRFQPMAIPKVLQKQKRFDEITSQPVPAVPAAMISPPANHTSSQAASPSSSLLNSNVPESRSGCCGLWFFWKLEAS